METPAAGPNPPVFSSHVLTDLYLRGRHDELSEGLLSVLRHFRETSYAGLDRQGRHFLDEFVKHFLNLFSQADYAPGRDHLIEFIRHNLTISNLAAVSTFGTTDPYPALAGDGPASLGKVLALCSARNDLVLDRASFFEADPVLASVWYGAYAEIYQGGLTRQDVSDRLKEHFAFQDDRLNVGLIPLDGYFASTYVDVDGDRPIKRRLNAEIRRLAGARNVRIRNRPDPKKIAVLSGNWAPDHSVYRITHAYLEALKGYHLTFFQLGARADVDHGLFQEVRRIDFDGNGVLDLAPVLENDFTVAYFPDVGLTPHSILLANLRLAPIQIASPGHSVSTWGAEIDYFVSGADVEPADDPGRNYSERLVLLPGSGAVHNRPRYTPAGRRKTAAEFLINCSWSAPKVNHALCRALAELIGRARRPVRLRLFVGASLNRQNSYMPFVRDLHAILGDPSSVEVVAGLSYVDYMNVMEEGDICLDSYHFGGCNTVADSLFLRKLTVSREGDRWYNRIGPRMLRTVGLPELVASTEQEYVDLTLRLIDDDDFRAGLQARLNATDLDATVFSKADARFFPEAVRLLIANHDRLRQDPDRTPIRIGW